MIRVGSDFSGVGAFDQALRRLGIDYKTVFACEMDKYARETYIHNYGQPNEYPEDVHDRGIPDEPLEIFCSTPPCQSFSIAGRRKGQEDKRGILFYNSHELIQKNKPRYFIFENVKGLLSDDNGRTFQRWCAYLGGKSVNGNHTIFPMEEAVPYHLYYAVLDAKKHGVCQSRDRVFLVGIRDDEDNNFIFPPEEHLTKRLKDVLEEEVDDKYFLSDKFIEGLMTHKERHKERGNGFAFEPKTEMDIGNCVTARCYKMGAADNYLKVDMEEINSKDGLTSFGNSQDLRLSPLEGCSQTLNAGHFNQPKILLDYRIRRLTPRECFRLMDFPDSFTWTVSDTQAYKQAGNSIVIGILEKIIRRLNL